jgi:hypothetical protein
VDKDASREGCREKLSGLLFILKIIKGLDFLMNSDEIFATAKQLQDFFSLQSGWCAVN